MHSILALTLLLFVLSEDQVLGVLPGFPTTCSGPVTGPADYSYTPFPYALNGPMFWWMLHRKNRDCIFGNFQSPFDMPPKKCQATGRPKVVFGECAHSFKTQPGNFKFVCEKKEKPCGTIEYNDKKYVLDHVHFHHSSEHHMNGTMYPLEAHFVHKSENGELAVYGVFFRYGRSNENVQKFIEMSTEGGNGTVSLDQFYKSKSTICATQGSLTTPPCAQGVQWFLQKDPIVVSKRQVAKFWCMSGNAKNNRPLQRLNRRPITCHCGEEEEAPEDPEDK